MRYLLPSVNDRYITASGSLVVKPSRLPKGTIPAVKPGQVDTSKMSHDEIIAHLKKTSAKLKAQSK